MVEGFVEQVSAISLQWARMWQKLEWMRNVCGVDDTAVDEVERSSSGPRCHVSSEFSTLPSLRTRPTTGYHWSSPASGSTAAYSGTSPSLHSPAHTSVILHSCMRTSSYRFLAYWQLSLPSDRRGTCQLNWVNERTNEVYLPLNGVNNNWLPVKVEAHQSWPPKKEK